MSIVAFVVTDGRRACMARTMSSLEVMVMYHAPIVDRFIVDDSGDPTYARWLDETYPRWRRIHHATRRGFCGAYQSAWSEIPATAKWVFSSEDDFLFNSKVDLSAMIKVLEKRPYLAQMALKRQPVNEQEIAAGDLYAAHPGDFEQHDDGWNWWLEQRRWFTSNASLYLAAITRAGWPDPPACEGMLTHRLLEDPATRFGYWGTLADDPWITHIGEERVGSGY